jgi:hypothetical protein
VLVVDRLAAAITVRLDLGNRASVAIGYACTDQEALVGLRRQLGLRTSCKQGLCCGLHRFSVKQGRKRLFF